MCQDVVASFSTGIFQAKDRLKIQYRYRTVHSHDHSSVLSTIIRMHCTVGTYDWRWHIGAGVGMGAAGVGMGPRKVLL
jgi:hypothetical protein